jgi:uncharacterized membrane protein YadS
VADGALRLLSTTALRWAPGVAATVAAVVVAVLVARAQPALGALVVALALGVALRNTGGFVPALRPGVTGSTKRLLRTGIVVLGLQLALGDVVALGPAVVALIVLSVAAGFLFTAWVGRRAGLSPAGATLMAAGFSICGASAVAGLQGVVDADDEEVAAAVTMVTLYGSLSIVVLPLLGTALHLPDERFGLWVGLSVHEVGQVVAAAGTAGVVALSVATVVKLGRVVLLAPVAAGVAWRTRRAARAALAPGSAGGAGGAVGAVGAGGAASAPVVPLFVVGFLVAVGLRSTGWLPGAVVEAAPVVTTVLLAGAMFGLGTSISAAGLVRSGGPWLVVGAVSTLVLSALMFTATALV